MRKQVRSGVTIVELLVVIGIVGLLLSISIPAVQQARASSRVMQCRNNLRQIGLAMGNFVEANGAFPTASQPHSTHRRLLFYLDAAQIGETLLADQVPDSWVVPTLACPSDPVVHVNMEKHGDSSYFLNHGSIFGSARRGKNGFFRSSYIDLSPRDFTDGLSSTVAMSERLVRTMFPVIGDEPTMIKSPGRFYWWTETRYLGAGNEALAVENCKNHRTVMEPQFYGSNNTNYYSGDGYRHLLTPNHPSCYNGPEDFLVSTPAILTAASSLHHGGVNSLMVDGSVHFISDSIDETVWQSLGSRNGNETISEF
ncbi:DUF1559 family PulG-like putative transporter [Thalassoglobus polymorphus]|uniref:DUF1559 domain-containing protein n=1 Tax=Thalassoglobus polymorphus TaxID=2527994 RepID=A0A517QIG1_9PLAN|nr:DUF1559 domain-containing protein [Thalassoglobus polymorphus]QDT31423.1 hypothetical protein Mal48_06560 [Thalassoglobus polymorphus]